MIDHHTQIYIYIGIWGTRIKSNLNTSNRNVLHNRQQTTAVTLTISHINELLSFFVCNNKPNKIDLKKKCLRTVDWNMVAQFRTRN